MPQAKDGEVKICRFYLFVTLGDSAPKGRASDCQKSTARPRPPLTRGLSSVARLGERHYKFEILPRILLLLIVSPSVSLRLTPPSSEGGEGKAVL